MSDTPTPETNAESYYPDGCGECVDADFARKLERERDEWKGLVERSHEREEALIEQNNELRLECDELQRNVERLENLAYVPGVWACAKCSVSVIISTLNAHTGAITTNKTSQACPNGCGPLLRKTERDAGNKVCDDLECVVAECDEFKEAARIWENEANRRSIKYETAVQERDEARQELAARYEQIAVLKDSVLRLGAKP